MAIDQPMIELVLDSLACQRGGRPVFEGLSVRVKAGHLLYLKGANGCGKSTLLRILGGLLAPSSGTVSYDGTVLQQHDIPFSAYALYLGHQNALKPIWTLRQNCDALCRIMTGRDAPVERLLETAEHFDLSRLLDQPVRYFSSGQKHRAALMRFGLIDRPVWLMDEPTVGLDSKNRDALAGLMEKKLASGGIILAATHDPVAAAGTDFDVSAFAPASDNSGPFSSAFLEDWA
ncbi:cytochrome c biogenesis ATP-binding export protein CcmA [Kordiimonas sediminis]|uniref:Cytochrome c biogenesis ATP-binding export protein CcmA n=1 Tax=Kordiimonas sediminis TaxID=1735581 RepID=A0A919E517_9PROT|nr:heme ABC exporter ATP-binding protein CcmA [Kordiimonas sediminis]GHF14431.1 cytochrome c biogenesis ATP-binding export protein CcmA [Kordiimonas sediminis]